MPNKSYTKQLGVRLAEPVLTELQSRAKAEDLKVSDIIRRAVRLYLLSACAPTESN